MSFPVASSIVFYHQVSEVHNCYFHAGSTFPTTLAIAVGTVTCRCVSCNVLFYGNSSSTAYKMLKRMTCNKTTESQDKPHLYAKFS